RITEEYFSATILIPTVPGVKAAAVYSVFTRNEVFPIIRELLVGLLSFLLITALLIIFYPQLAKKNASSAFAGSDENETANRSDFAQQAEAPLGTAEAAEPSSPEPAASPAAPPAAPTVVPHAARSDSVESAENGGLYSPNSELGWEDYLEERLSAELKRAASFDQDLVLLLGSVRGLKKSDPLYISLSQTAREFFNFQDLCFEYGKSGIGVIVPNIDVDQGIERIESFKKRVDDLVTESGSSSKFIAGISARNGRLISGDRIIREARSALKRADKGPDQIIGFRVDPVKYRNYIASKATSNPD
ncbi:MAG: hypothetical protein HN368_04840, partial [Spirochaetales bacterium]|nr:hypothetical protein [Spirochaetales bacterium]